MKSRSLDERIAYLIGLLDLTCETADGISTFCEGSPLPHDFDAAQIALHDAMRHLLRLQRQTTSITPLTTNNG